MSKREDFKKRDETHLVRSGVGLELGELLLHVVIVGRAVVRREELSVSSING